MAKSPMPWTCIQSVSLNLGVGKTSVEMLETSGGKVKTSVEMLETSGGKVEEEELDTRKSS